MQDFVKRSISVMGIDLEDDDELAELADLFVGPASNGREYIGVRTDRKETIEAHATNELPESLVLPDAPGCKMLAIATAYHEEPLILLVGSLREVERVMGIEGAQEAASADQRSLKARLKTLRNRITSGHRTTATYAGIEVDGYALTASVNGIDIGLTPTELRLLQIFVHHPGRVFTRDELLDATAGSEAAVSDRSVDSHITNLRKKLSERIRGRAQIHTVHGVGYKLE